MPFAENQGVRLYWTESGVGEPLLLIMGLGYPHDMWYRAVPALSAKYRVIAFDNRGVGRSDVPAGPYTMAQMAADAAAVLDAAGVGAAHVYGISMGGMIAQEFVLQYPERVKKLVLGCTTCGGPEAVRAEQDAVTVLLNRGRMTREEAAVAALPFIYDVKTPRELIDEDVAVRMPFTPTPEGYTAQLQAILGWSSWERLEQVKSPTLVIHGATDRLVPAGNGRVVARRIAGAEYVEIPEASHIFMTDQPELSTRAVLEFLARP